MPRGIRKNKDEVLSSPSPSAENTEDTIETVKLEDGTEYKTVAGRKAAFNINYPNGMINPVLLTDPNNKDYFVFKAVIYPDTVNSKDRYFTGYGQCERIPGDKFASLEKAETTAIGRALSHMAKTLAGAGASEEEIEKAKGVTAFQKSLRETVQEEKPVENPKGQPDTTKLEGDELSVYNEWAFNLVNCVTKEALTAYGIKIKDAKLPSRVTEELRKLFNKQLRALAQKKEENNV